MQKVTRRLRTISESLVDFARVRQQHMEPLGVRAVVDEAWGLVALDEKASGVTFTNTVGDASVNGNGDKLVQVFVNLLRNAVIAFDAPGGHVEVKARPQDRAGRKGLAIAVEDNGPGIPPAVLPNVFDAFVTSRLDARGTGLGLTIAQGIVAQHGGTITASNRKEGGACLEVWLPA
jgi:signal transduction histidine kinase